MRRITDEQSPSVPERAHPPALESVHARPFDLELDRIAKHRAQAWKDFFGLLLLIRIGIPPELKVNAPDIIGLAMQQRRLVAMEWRIEPEPALGGKVRRHVNVGDEKAIAENLAFALHPEHAPDGAPRAVGDDQPVRMQRVLAVGR